MKNIWHSNSAKDTIECGRAIAKELRGGSVVSLIGELGSGKTTLVKGIALGLGVKDANEVRSPTFVILHIYGQGMPDSATPPGADAPLAQKRRRISATKTSADPSAMSGGKFTQQLACRTVARSFDKGRFPLYHFDLYRLESDADIEAVGMDEFLADSKAVSVIEWADRIPSVLKRSGIHIRLSATGEKKRTIRVTKNRNEK